MLLAETVLAPTCLVTASPAIGQHRLSTWQWCFSAAGCLRTNRVAVMGRLALGMDKHIHYRAEDGKNTRKSMPVYETDHMKQGMW